MANTEITITLTPQERRSLSRIANYEHRTPEAQLKYLLIKEARRRGLLTSYRYDGDDDDAGLAPESDVRIEV